MSGKSPANFVASALITLVLFSQNMIFWGPFVGIAEAAVPKVISYQGRLEDSSGNLLGSSSGTNFDFQFSIWDSSSTSGGTMLWPASATSTTIPVYSGVFDARLGDPNQGFSALNIDFNTSTILYLQIKVSNAGANSFETLSPRQPIVSSGFAINAGTLNGFTQGTSSNNLLLLDQNGSVNLQSGASVSSTNVSSTNATLSGYLALTGISASQCLHVTAGGVIAGTGSDCLGGAASAGGWTNATSATGNFTFLATNTGLVGIGATSSAAKLLIQSTTVSTTTLLLQGMAAQTADILQAASSSGQILFQISSIGVASSSEFRSPSSTIGTLTVGTCVGCGGLTSGVDSQVLFGQLGGSATSSRAFTFASSTGLFSVLATTSLASASTTGNVTIGGSFQSNAGQNTFGNVSSTNENIAGYLSVVGTSTLPVLKFTNASGTNIDLTGYLKINGDKVSTSTGSTFTSGVDTQLLFGQLGGGATSSLLMTLVSSTGALTFNTTTSLGSVSSTGNIDLTTGYIRLNSRNVLVGTGIVDGQALFGLQGTSNTTSTSLITFATSTGLLTVGSTSIGNVSGTPRIDAGRITFTTASSSDNVTVGGSLQANVSQTTLASVSSTNLFANGYLFVQGVANQVQNLLTLSSSSNQLFFTVSPMGLASSSQFRSPSSTIGTLTVVTSLLDVNGNKYSTSSDTFVSRGLDTQLLFGQLGGGATSSLLMTLVSSTGALVFNTTTSLQSVSSTNMFVNGYLTVVGNLADNFGNKYSTSTGSTFTSGVDSQVLFGQLGGGATSSALFTITTSTGLISLSSTTVTGQLTVGSASSSGNMDLTTGYLRMNNVPVYNGASVDSQILFGQLSAAGFSKATSSLLLTLSSSTGLVSLGSSTVTGQLTIGSASSSGNMDFTTGYLRLNGRNAVVATGIVDGNALMGILGTSNSTSTLLTTFTTSTGVFAINASTTMQNVSSTGNIDLTTGYLRMNGVPVHTGAVVDGQMLFGILSPAGFSKTSSSLLLSITTSTGLISLSSTTVTGQTTLASVSSTNLFANGYLTVQGTTNQTQNLLTLSSSTNQLFFTVSPMGLASSSQFRSPSSTITNLTLLGITGTRCLRVDANGVVSAASIDCLTASSGSGAGWFNTTSTKEEGYIQLITNTNLVNIGGAATSTASSSKLFVQSTSVGTSTLTLSGLTNQEANLFTIASSTGLQLFGVNSIGQVAIGTSTINSSSTLFTIASSSLILTISANGFEGLGTDRPSSTLHIKGKTNQINDLFSITSSTGQNFLTVSPMGVASSSELTSASSSFTTSTITNLSIGSTISGAGLTSCSVATSSKLLWNSTTGQFSCGNDTSLRNVINYATSTTFNLVVASTTITDPVSITLATNKNAVLVTLVVEVDGLSATGANGVVSLYRASSTSVTTSSLQVGQVQISSNDILDKRTNAIVIVDSPATSSIVTYKAWANYSAASLANLLERYIILEEVQVGADLAETYSTTDSLIAAGDIVSIDPANNEGVVKSAVPYDGNTVGIVSTKPSLVIGAAETRPGVVALVALAGRVPVKISSENGQINPGDYITPSSMPGVGMKATKAGVVVGRAMSSFWGKGIGTVLAFAQHGYYNGTTRGLKDANGSTSLTTSGTSTTPSLNGSALLIALLNQPPQAATGTLSEIFTDRLVAGLEVVTPRVITNELAVSTITPVATSGINLVLSPEGKFVIMSATSTASSTESGASSTTGVAISFDASGNALFAGKITAQSIAANTIEGMSVITDKLTSLSNEVTTLSSSSRLTALELVASSSLVSNGGLSVAGQAEFASSTVFNADVTVSGTLAAANIKALSIDSPELTQVSSTIAGLASTTQNFSDRLTSIEKILSALAATSTNAIDIQSLIANAGAITVRGSLTVNDGLRVDMIGSLTGAVNFSDNVIFFGRPYFNSDTGGFAKILKGATSADVTFTKEYLEEPVVNASIALGSSAGADISQIAQNIFASDVRYLITNKTTKGFTIELNKPASDDITFGWIALAVKGAKTFESTGGSSPAASPPPPPPTASASSTATSTPDSATATSSDPSISPPPDTTPSSTDPTSTPPDTSTSTPTPAP